MACTTSKEELTRVKGLGFLNNKGTDYFNGRVITRNGKITSKDRIDITATDKVTIRPQTYLDETHRTYGVINAENNINIIKGDI